MNGRIGTDSGICIYLCDKRWLLIMCCIDLSWVDELLSLFFSGWTQYMFGLFCYLCFIWKGKLSNSWAVLRVLSKGRLLLKIDMCGEESVIQTLRSAIIREKLNVMTNESFNIRVVSILIWLFSITLLASILHKSKDKLKAEKWKILKSSLNTKNGMIQNVNVSRNSFITVNILPVRKIGI